MNQLFPSLHSLPIEIYADGADKAGIFDLYKKPYIKGLTTNPTLMKKAGIKDYEVFAREVLEVVTDKPISFEVFSDDYTEMLRQATKISSWGDNVYVKIPITNTKGTSSGWLIRELSQRGVKLNITAILTLRQVYDIIDYINLSVPAILSVFAGHIMDTGENAMTMMQMSYAAIKDDRPNVKLLWASVREVYNLIQAVECNCHIITVPHDILAKAEKLLGKDNTQLSLETVQMFTKDAADAGFQL